MIIPCQWIWLYVHVLFAHCIWFACLLIFFIQSMQLWHITWGKYYFCTSCVDSKSYRPMVYLPQYSPDFTSYRACAAINGRVWHTVNCGAIWLVIACSILVTSLLTLLYGVILSLSPPLFIIDFPQLIHVFGSAACYFGNVLCSTGTVCMKMSSNYPVPFFVPIDIVLSSLCFFICATDQHTTLKWLVFWQLLHIFPYAGHCLWGCTVP